jgi:hypothetical protein
MIFYEGRQTLQEEIANSRWILSIHPLYSEKSHNIETNSVRNVLFNKFYNLETF